MRSSSVFWAMLLAMAATATASPVFEDAFSDVGAREVDDPDCCGTGYSEPACETKDSSCDGAAACCPLLVGGVSPRAWLGQRTKLIFAWP